MSTIEYIHNRAGILPEHLQREVLDFIDFLTVKYQAIHDVQLLSAQEILLLPKEKRAVVMAHQADLMRHHYTEHPEELLPDILDDIIEETP